MRIRNIFLRIVLLLLVSVSNMQAIAYLYSHGFGSLAERYLWYQQKNNRISRFVLGEHYLFCNDNVHFVRYNDLKLKIFPYYLRNSCLGQDGDMQVLHRGCHAIDDDVVLFGVSRGAATAVNFVARYWPANVKAAIFESPFDTGENGMDGFLSHWGVGRCERLKNCFKNMFRWVSQYDPNGIHPVTVAQNLDPELPVLFVCSKEDTLINYEQTINVYKKVIEAGHQKAHLLILDKGRHGRLLWGTDGQKYQDVTHAFYRKYELPYTDAFAGRGQVLFGQCQPTMQELEQLLAADAEIVSRGNIFSRAFCAIVAFFGGSE